MSEVYYGINTSLVPDDISDKPDFIRCLFFSQALTSSDVNFIISVNGKLGRERVVKLHEILKTEIAKEALSRKSLADSIFLNKKTQEYYTKNKANIDITAKLISWTQYFGKLSNLEISDYYNFFSIGLRESFDLRTSFNTDCLTKPADIFRNLREFVIGQDEAVKNISFAFYLHLVRTRRITPEIYKITNASRMQGDIRLPESHLMLIGPTGSGKTHIIKTLCDLYEIPFVKVDCAQLIASGYVGINLEDALTMLLLKSKSIHDAQRGVVYFDEFDKISEHFSKSSSGNLGGVVLQQEFLSLFDDDEKMIRETMGKYAERISFKTSRLMFIFSGSFYGIENFIRERLAPNTIGFSVDQKNSTVSAADIQKYVTTEDFISFGIIPELIGRVNYYVALDSLTRDQIIEIIKNTKSSYLSGFENFFWIHYDKLIIDDEVYGLIADRVIKNKLGARSIKSVLQKLLSDALFRSPNIMMETFHITANDFNKTFNHG